MKRLRQGCILLSFFLLASCARSGYFEERQEPKRRHSHTGERVAPEISLPEEPVSGLVQVDAKNYSRTSVVILDPISGEELSMGPGYAISWQIDPEAGAALQFLWGTTEANRLSELPDAFALVPAASQMPEVQLRFQDREDQLRLKILSRRQGSAWQAQEYVLEEDGSWTPIPDPVPNLFTTEIVNATADMALTFDQLEVRGLVEDHQPDLVTLTPGEAQTVADREIHDFFYSSPPLQGRNYFSDLYNRNSGNYLEDIYSTRAVFSGNAAAGYRLDVYHAETGVHCEQYRLLAVADKWYFSSDDQIVYLVDLDPDTAMELFPHAGDLRDEGNSYHRTHLFWSDEPLYDLEVASTFWGGWWLEEPGLVEPAPQWYTSLGDLLPGSPILVNWVDAGSSHYRLIRCRDAAGRERFFSVGVDERGGDAQSYAISEYFGKLVPELEPPQ